MSRGFRQFFIAYLMSGKKFVVHAVGSGGRSLARIHPVHARVSRTFCRRGFGGFLHHTAGGRSLRGEDRCNDGLRRAWWYTCKYENIDPRYPTRLPLLFALDAKLKIPAFVTIPTANDVEQRAASALRSIARSHLLIGLATAGFGGIRRSTGWARRQRAAALEMHAGAPVPVVDAGWWLPQMRRQRRPVQDVAAPAGQSRAFAHIRRQFQAPT